jgi:MHS family proline/betaine transporter-like MFS transporter
MAIALVIGTPLFIFFGAWSDKVGRKFIMLTGMILAVVLYRPIYKQMYTLTDITKKVEVKERESIERSFAMMGTDSVRTIKRTHIFTDSTSVVEIVKEKNGLSAEPKKEISLDGINYWEMVGLIFIQVILVTMVYGPIAAFLVELFPTRIRYTSMSLPYHIGNGIFGGLTPFIATALYELSKSEKNPAGDPFAGLWYPIIVAGICFIIGMIFLSNKRKAEVVE